MTADGGRVCFTPGNRPRFRMQPSYILAQRFGAWFRIKFFNRPLHLELLSADRVADLGATRASYPGGRREAEIFQADRADRDLFCRKRDRVSCAKPVCATAPGSESFGATDSTRPIGNAGFAD